MVLMRLMRARLIIDEHKQSRWHFAADVPVLRAATAVVTGRYLQAIANSLSQV